MLSLYISIYKYIHIHIYLHIYIHTYGDRATPLRESVIVPPSSAPRVCRGPRIMMTNDI